MTNLIEGLHSEMNRVRELVKEYEALPDGVGFMGASIMKAFLQQAEKAIEEGDIVAELRAHQSLKDCTG